MLNRAMSEVIHIWFYSVLCLPVPRLHCLLYPHIPLMTGSSPTRLAFSVSDFFGWYHLRTYLIICFMSICSTSPYHSSCIGNCAGRLEIIWDNFAMNWRILIGIRTLGCFNKVAFKLNILLRTHIQTKLSFQQCVCSHATWIIYYVL